MKISVNTGSDSRFELLKRCGFDACDFSLGNYLERSGSLGDIYNISDAQIEETFTKIRENGEKVGFEIGQTHSAFSRILVKVSSICASEILYISPRDPLLSR